MTEAAPDAVDVCDPSVKVQIGTVQRAVCFRSRDCHNEHEVIMQDVHPLFHIIMTHHKVVAAMVVFTLHRRKIEPR